jgi:hypothetical protein
MNGWSALDRFLRTDPQDVGCAQAMEMLHIYAERISKGCWPRSATRPADRHPYDSAPRGA